MCKPQQLFRFTRTTCEINTLRGCTRRLIFAPHVEEGTWNMFFKFNSNTKGIEGFTHLIVARPIVVFFVSFVLPQCELFHGYHDTLIKDIRGVQISWMGLNCWVPFWKLYQFQFKISDLGKVAHLIKCFGFWESYHVVMYDGENCNRTSEIEIWLWNINTCIKMIHKKYAIFHGKLLGGFYILSYFGQT